MSNARELAELSGSYGTGGFVGMKNRIINGAMMIDQRNAGASVNNAAGALYTLDRWSSTGFQASKFSIQQTPSATESGFATRVNAGFTNYLACTSSSAYSVPAGEFFTVNQAIEGYNVADLAFGTSNAKTVTLSFWVRSSLTGTFGGSLNNSGASRSYPFTYTISAANTWEQKSITVAGDTSGTWLTTNGVGLNVHFGLGVGSTFSGSAGAWASADYRSATGATSVVGTNGATFYITGVQLEKGSTATSFDYRPYGTELALCQRYCYAQKSSAGNLFYSFGVASGNSTTPVAYIKFPTTMRTTPSLSASAGSTFLFANFASSTTINLDQTSEDNAWVYGAGGGAATNGFSGRFLANNSASAYLIWNSEL